MSEKPKNKPSKWEMRLALLLLIVVASFVLCFVYLASMIVPATFQANVVDFRGEEARELIEAEPYSLPLPDEASDIYFYSKAWLDVRMNIRFSASPQSVEAWLFGHDFCFTELIENEPVYLFVDEPNLEWWQANEASRYSVAEQCGDSPYYIFMIDQSNPELWIVYLIIFTT